MMPLRARIGPFDPRPATIIVRRCLNVIGDATDAVESVGAT